MVKSTGDGELRRRLAARDRRELGLVLAFFDELRDGEQIAPYVEPREVRTIAGLVALVHDRRRHHPYDFAGQHTACGAARVARANGSGSADHPRPELLHLPSLPIDAVYAVLREGTQPKPNGLDPLADRYDP